MDVEAYGAAADWLWELRAADGRVVSAGVYAGRCWAPPVDAAAEVMALLIDVRVGQALDAGRTVLDALTPMAGMVCRVWRRDAPEVWAEEPADEWIRTLRVV